MANENTKERIRIRYEVAAIQGLCANPQIFFECRPSNKPDINFNPPEYIAKLAKAIANEMLKEPEIKNIKLDNDGK